MIEFKSSIQSNFFNEMLPNETIDHIFKWLPIPFLPTLRLVCKKWNQIIIDPVFWNSYLPPYLLSNTSHQTSDAFKRVLDNYYLPESLAKGYYETYRIPRLHREALTCLTTNYGSLVIGTAKGRLLIYDLETYALKKSFYVGDGKIVQAVALNHLHLFVAVVRQIDRPTYYTYSGQPQGELQTWKWNLAKPLLEHRAPFHNFVEQLVWKNKQLIIVTRNQTYYIKDTDKIESLKSFKSQPLHTIQLFDRFLETKQLGRIKVYQKRPFSILVPLSLSFFHRTQIHVAHHHLITFTHPSRLFLSSEQVYLHRIKNTSNVTNYFSLPPNVKHFLGLFSLKIGSFALFIWPILRIIPPSLKYVMAFKIINIAFFLCHPAERLCFLAIFNVSIIIAREIIRSMLYCNYNLNQLSLALQSEYQSWLLNLIHYLYADQRQEAAEFIPYASAFTHICPISQQPVRHPVAYKGIIYEESFLIEFLILASHTQEEENPCHFIILKKLALEIETTWKQIREST